MMFVDGLMDASVQALPVVYHYTSIQALHAIVTTGRLRMSNVLFMNDPEEMAWMIRKFSEALRARDHKVGAEAERRCTLANLTSSDRFRHIYSASFTPDSDSLSQWIQYGENGAGVTIGIHVGTVVESYYAESSDRLTLARCEARRILYGEDVLTEHINALLNDSDQHGSHWATPAHIHDLLIDLAPKFKRPSFQNEKEVRLIVRDARTLDHPDDAYRLLSSPAFFEGVDFYQRGAVLVPCVEIPIPASAIQKIVLGPRFSHGWAETAVQLLTARYGLQAKVERSKLTYRG